MNSPKLAWQETGLRWLWLALVIVIADQATKLWVANTFTYRETVEFIPYLQWTYVHNEGAAFSFLSDAGGWQRWFFAFIAFAISGVLLYWLKGISRHMLLQSVSFSLVLGGAIGNLIDRVYLGYVIDFIDFYIGNWHWPAFNIADSAICIGAVLLILDALKGESRHEEAKGKS
ncbi:MULTISPECIES: signal peptidase II [Corallincola]|uniref:signal peptidase II n=1 Tax=Corallincola TaxID=1775176 RepID=UPI001F0EDB8E|nr:MULTISPECIES: signal peptidase II [Corallincola]